MITIDKSFLVIRSVTDAMRGQKLLVQQGFTATVQRNTAPSARQGCGYGLLVMGDAVAAAGILSRAGIRVTEMRRG